MKKLIALILAMLMCLAGLSACTAVDEPGTETTTDAPETGTAAPETDASETETEAPETDTTASETEAPETDTTAPETEPETTPATPDVEYDLEAAAEYVNSLYKKGETITAADYQVVGQVMIAGVKYMVTWTADNDKVKLVEGNPYWTVDVDEKAKEEHSYKLTATITAGDGTTTTVSFDRTVPEYVLWSFEEYINAPEGTTVVIEGIVVAMNSKSLGNTRNHLFLADVEGKGGYYCYQLDTDPVEAGVKVGMTVSVTAVTAPYSGMQETKGGTFTIVDETIKTVEPVDITDKFIAGESLKNYVGLPVVIKGVTIGTQDLATATSQYLYFERDGQKAYVRSYVTDFPTSLQIIKGENGAISSPDKDAMDADHAAHFGYTADATGILILYSGNPYLIPMSATPFTNYEFVEMTADEKIAAELGDLKLDASASSDVVIDLLSVGKYYNDVTFAWATDDTTGAATIDGGKLSLVIPDAQVTVNITVTATCGEATATKTFAIKLSKTITSVKDIIAIGSAKDHNTYTEEKYIAGGIIVEIKNDVYGNIVIKDESGESILVYGTFIDGKKYGEFEGDKPVVGDYVVVIGIVGQYNGTAQMKNADITSFTKPSALKDALDAGAAQEHNTYTEEKYLVTGVVTEIANTTYGNLYIQDADGNTLYIYGLYNQANVRFDKLATQPAVGDTITVLSTAGQYNGKPQLKNAVLVSLTPAEDNDDNNDDNNDDPSEETGPVEMTIPEANAAADGTDVIVIGTVQEINTEWSDQYNNITVTIVDDEGNTLYIYRLATKVNVGDKIKITGKVGSYNGSKQIAAGATAEVLAAAPSEMTIPEVLASEDGTDVIVRGTVKEINTPWSDQYGNITVTIEDAEGNTLYVYRMKTDVKVGDVITITGKVGSYNGSKQIAAGATAVIESTGDDSGDDTPVENDPVEMTIPEANAAADDTKVIVTGTVKEINTPWSDQYSNITVTIVDAEGNTLYVYRLATKVNVGDEITVTGKMATYNGSRQVAAGATAEIIAAHTCTDFTDATCTAPKTCTVCGATEGSALGHSYVDGTCTGCGAAEPSGDQTEFKVTIADFAAANGWENSQPYTEFNLNGDISVTATGTPVGNYGQNTGKYYTNGENWRIYQNEVPAVTISVAEGKTIVSVKISYATKNDGVLTLADAQIESGAVVTVNANSVTFSVGNTGTKTNGQVQITAIEVIYQ